MSKWNDNDGNDGNGTCITLNCIFFIAYTVQNMYKCHTNCSFMDGFFYNNKIKISKLKFNNLNLESEYSFNRTVFTR